MIQTAPPCPPRSPRWEALKARHLALQDRISEAARRVHRSPHHIHLLAVSKGASEQDVCALAELGQTAFGENYVQEGLSKMAACANPHASDLSERSDRPDKGVGCDAPKPLIWHFIGPIQANKTRKIAEHFDWVQSVDQARLADRLAEQRPDQLGPLEVCIQVNLGGESSKRGCPPEQALALAQHIQQRANLRPRGLMIIPEADLSLDQLSERFAQGAALFQSMQKTMGPQIDTLSMGMSDDLELAIAAGSTMIRIGSALFGPRQS
jgi:uncharacterized pyridoxal phosphate-containing UPF0001 family protein